MYSNRLNDTYLLDELFNNLDNMFIKLIKKNTKTKKSVTEETFKVTKGKKA